MIFGEIFYAVFLFLTLLLFYTVPRRFKMAVIAASGVLFYAYYAGTYVVLLLLLTAISWLVMFARPAPELAPPDAATSPDPQTAVVSRQVRVVGVVAVIVFVLVLSFFKYGAFLSSIFSPGLLPGVAAPLAISFFTFEFIHVAAEYLKGNIRRAPFVEYFAFIFFFPTMIAGPIKRYDQFDEQFDDVKLSPNDIVEGLFRIAIGLFKKAVIADNLNTLITEIGTPEKTGNVILLTGAIVLYGFRIYLDFSGYSDIAIGSARLFGIRVPENFLYPYRQSNISAFWRNWHISLYTWLIDYIFIPLGGSRVAFGRVLFNIMMVMLVSGIWHGAAWNFILWGLWHGVLLVIHKVYTDKIMPHLNAKWVASRSALVISYGMTMAAVWFGWLLFMWPLSAVGRYLQLVWLKLS